MLNTRNEGTNKVFYSYLACFVNTFTMNMYVSMSYTGLIRVYPSEPPPLTQRTAAKRPAAPAHECTGPASTGPRRIATEETGRVSRTATGQPQRIGIIKRVETRGVESGFTEGVKGALQLLINRYGEIRFAQVPERVSTKSVVVFINRSRITYG